MKGESKQPPALGGEPEVLAMLTSYGNFYFPNKNVEVSPKDIALIDRAHVARFQAEIERLKELATRRKNDQTEMCTEIVDLIAERDTLKALLREADDFMYIMTGNDTQRQLDAKYGSLLWEDAICNLRGRIAIAFGHGAALVKDGENGEELKPIYADVPATTANCKTCDGSGIEHDGAGHTCTTCNGSGAYKDHGLLQGIVDLKDMKP